MTRRAATVLMLLFVIGLLVGAAYLGWALIESINQWSPRREM